MDASQAVPVLRMGNIVGGRLDVTSLKYLPGQHEEFPKLLLEPGDLLFNRTNSPELVGKSAVYSGCPPVCSFASYLIRVRLYGLDPMLVAGYINSIHGRRWVRSVVAQQVGQANVNGTKLKALELPVPPLNEQRRIVAKIEALTDKSQHAKEALDAIPPLLERFRQSVLAAAFRGDLTKDWRAKNPDVEPADQLLARIRKERHARWEEAQLAKMRARGKEPKNDKWKAKYKEPEPVDTVGLPELPRGWRWVGADEIAWEITVGHVGPMQTEYQSEGVPFLRSQNVRENRFDPTELRFISPRFHEKLSKSVLRPGDVAIVRSGAPGTTCVIPADLPEANCADLVIVRLLSGIDSHLLAFYLNSAGARARIRGVQVGVAQQHFNVGSMKRKAIPLLPEAEQRVMLEAVHKLEAHCRRISEAVAVCLDSANGLDQAALAKAFRGGLVPQDPNDEPASVLLERIRSERELEFSTAKKGKRSSRKRRG